MCYHEESLHRDNTSPPPALPAPIATSSLSPLLANRPNNPPGIPTNTAIPILRSFQPFQPPPSSTAEDNRQRSIARMNITSSKSKKKGRLPTKAATAPPVIRDASILFLPISVSRLNFSPLV